MRGKGPGRRTPRRFRTTGAVTPQRALVGAMAVSLLLTALILLPPRLRQRRTSWSRSSFED